MHTQPTQGAGADSFSPIEGIGPRIPIYTENFAADPHGAYRQMRRDYGPLVPIEMWPGVPATLVTKYRTAVRILNDPEHFPADPRAWQKTVPADMPILPMVEWRPNAIRTSGAEHARYRGAMNDALAGIDLNMQRAMVEKSAIPITNTFCRDGQADVLSQYALPLVFSVLCQVLGCPQDIGEQVAAASAAMFDGVDTETVNAQMGSALLELTALKRAHPGDDVTTRLVQHPAGLTDEEMVHQLVLLFAAGVEPPVNLIANTLVMMLSDPRFTSNDHSLPLSTRSALDEMLAVDPPMANYCITYPRQPILIEKVWLPANQPVIISMAACNNDPDINTGEFAGNGWNLAFSSGPHACPAHARPFSYLLAQDAIDQLLDALPELTLAVPKHELVWRPGPFHRALTALPVVFPPSPPLSL
ncbi:cytochrome P450 [Nocardia cyriacigeorgica]|uniref:cytochrome P450 n=2 Tax=Nocardia cyriacigeorgica TaxID=135487 RepID=UPI0003092565|nr:cytochrome P450 [Nocardia cyriacigeorgica]AVH22935.1 cytochrome P450 [Nocardia cyriacigeorgica]MBF6322415.1 cytochrome P450 [Nocardia cyriacigeorgica]MBF6495723.1 cytochrome P450 [Nocardia cyriacigeorgica]PPJ16639.1 cytochrome P450 [Nocardia cyriacigeorgica]TLF61242.1 cytochrome P450 [Nocardia cyriacigeorgica]